MEHEHGLARILMRISKRRHWWHESRAAPRLPDGARRKAISVTDLPPDSTLRESHTQALGDAWLDEAQDVLLFVPSVIFPFAGIPDQNVLINHRAAGADRIRIADVSPFTLDPRLFSP